MRVRDGNRIYRGRRKQRYTQADLARLVNKTQQYISALENGIEATCSEETADRICHFLGLELEDVFEYPERSSMPQVTSSTHGASVNQTGRPRPRGSANPPVRPTSGSAA